MAEDLVISLGLDDKKVDVKIRKLKADFDSATASVRKQEKAVAAIAKELEYYKSEMKKSGDTISKTMMAEKITPLSQKLEEGEIKLQKLKASADIAGQKLEEAMDKGNKGTGRLINKLKSAGGAIAKFGKRISSLITSAFVFSVIYSGLNKLKQMISSYLKVNDKVSKSLALVKGNLLTAFQAIYDAALPALDKLTSALVTASAYVSYFFNALAGRKASDSAKAAEELYNQANATEEVAKATEKANKQLTEFDELNVVDVGDDSASSVGSSDSAAPNFGFDYSEINTQAVDRIVEKIQKIEGVFSKFKDFLSDFLNDGEKLLELVVTIGGVLLAWKIADGVSKFFNLDFLRGGIATVGLTVSVIGAQYLYDGAKNIALGDGTKEDWMSAIGGGLAILLGCTATGFAFGGLHGAAIGLAVGAVITAGLVIKACFDAKKQKEQDEFNRSELGKKILDIQRDIEEGSQVVADIKVKLRIAKENIEAVDESYDYAKNLLEEIFELNANADRSSGQQQLLQGLVDEFNKLGISEITLNVDTGNVEQAYDEVKKLTDQWYDLAKAQADREYLVELYKSQRKSSNVYAEAANNVDDSLSLYRKCQDELAEIQSKIDDIHQNSTNFGLIQASRMLDELEKQKADAEDRLEKARISSLNAQSFLYDTRKGLESITEEIEKITVASEKAPDDTFDGMRDSADEAAESVKDLFDLTKKLSEKNTYTRSHGIVQDLSANTFSSRVPGLAKGAVLPANRPFLAMLGDQHSGTNVEAPLSTIKQALQETMYELGGMSGGDIIVPIYIDGDKVDEVVVRRQEIRKKMYGV